MSGFLKASERSEFLRPLVRASFEEANSCRDSLTLIRPQSLALEATAKSASDLADERAKHAELANQLSMFDASAKPLVPCPMRFLARWRDQDGKDRSHECDDWETAAAYNRFERQYGQQEAMQILKGKYEDEYMKAGLVLGFSTHKRRNAEFGTQNQWLLVGMIRLDATSQGALDF